MPWTILTINNRIKWVNSNSWCSACSPTARKHRSGGKIYITHHEIIIFYWYCQNFLHSFLALDYILHETLIWHQSLILCLCAWHKLSNNYVLYHPLACSFEHNRKRKQIFINFSQMRRGFGGKMGESLRQNIAKKNKKNESMRKAH